MSKTPTPWKHGPMLLLFRPFLHSMSHAPVQSSLLPQRLHLLRLKGGHPAQLQSVRARSPRLIPLEQELDRLRHEGANSYNCWGTEVGGQGETSIERDKSMCKLCGKYVECAYLQVQRACERQITTRFERQEWLLVWVGV